MHELAICLALLDQVEGIVREQQAKRVRALVLRIGPLAGVETEALQRAYSVASAGTSAAQAQLLIERSSVRIRCLDCTAEADVPGHRLLCAACGSWHIRVVSGDELLLVRVDLDRELVDHV